MSKPSLIFISALLLFSANLSAQISTDGTLGPAQNLQGPKYTIGDDLGQQHGGNLFHSFQDFNLNSNESATFSGQNHIQNVISRVTGGNSSNIDGLIRSTIPGADFYFLNPYGIIFGETATLDVQGSFHASTADYLRLGEGGEFHARNPSKSLLTVAPIEAFGFFGQSESIKIEGSFLQTPVGKTLSIIGGDISIEDGVLFAPGGRINLAAIAFAGEVEITPDNLLINTSNPGEIRLFVPEYEESEYEEVEPDGLIDDYENDAIYDNGEYEGSELEFEPEFGNVDVTDHFNETGTGQIFIRGGKLIVERAGIFADTFDNEGGQQARIDIDINGDIALIDGGLITADSLSDSQGGNITINAENLTLRGQFEELSPDDDDFIDSLSTIGTDSFETGVAGNIDIELTGSLEMTPGLISSVAQNDSGEGEAGNIHIQARDVTLQQGASISVDTFGDRNAGNITINATDKISLLQTDPYGISSSASEEAMGHAGNIILNTSELVLTEEGLIYSLSYGSGDAGSITITANTAKLTQSRITTEAEQARGGNIYFEVRDKLELFDDSRITAEARGKNTQDSGGNITITSPALTLDDSFLLANAYAGNGGEIKLVNLDFNRFTLLGNSWIDVSSALSSPGEFWVNKIRLTDDLFVFSSPEFTEAKFSLDRCAGLTIDTISRFIITIRDVLPPSPGDLMTHSPLSW